MPDLGGSYFHLQQREQRPDLGLPAGVPRARLDLQGPRLDALVPALRHGHQPARDDRGLPGPRGPPDSPSASRWWTGRASRCSSGQRHRGRSRQTWQRPWDRTSSTCGSGKGTRASGSARARSSCPREGHSRSWSRSGGASSLAGATPDRSTSWRPFARHSGMARATRPRRPTSTASFPGPRSVRTRARASCTSRPAPARRTSSSGRASGYRSSGRSTRAACTTRASAG